MNEPDDDLMLLQLYRRQAQEQPRAAIDRRILARARQRAWRPALAAAAVLLMAGIVLLGPRQHSGSLAERSSPTRPAPEAAPLGSASTGYLLQADWRPGADQTASDIAAAIPCPTCHQDTPSR